MSFEEPGSFLHRIASEVIQIYIISKPKTIFCYLAVKALLPYEWNAESNMTKSALIICTARADIHTFSLCNVAALNCGSIWLFSSLSVIIALWLHQENTTRHLLFSTIFRYSNSFDIVVRCDAYQLFSFFSLLWFFVIVYGTRNFHLLLIHRPSQSCSLLHV